MKLKIGKETITRTALLIFALVNQALVIMGKPVLPVSDDQIQEILSLALTIGSSLWAWWENNSFTQAALKADEVLRKEKE